MVKSSTQQHSIAPTRATIERVALASLGAIIWAGLFWIRLFRIPPEWWRWRDDAVITLSHAKNLADYGSIGVSPGADRVEGFSAPLQFVISAIFFWITDAGYAVFLTLQVGIGITATGAICLLILLNLGESLGLSRVSGSIAAVFLTFVTGLLVVSSWTTVGWLVSGMENPLFMVFGMLFIWAGVKVRYQHLPLTLGLALGLLGLIRVELAALMAPALLAAVTLVTHRSPPGRKARNAVWVLVIPIGLWIIAHSARWIYFGSFLPNTALVQNRVSGLGQILTLLLLVVAVGVVTWVLIRPTRSFLPYIAVALLAVLYLVLVANDAMQYVLPAAGSNYPVVSSALALVITSIALLAFVASRSGSTWLPDILFVSVIFIPVAQFLVMGPARMEAFRVFSLVIPFLSLWLATIGLRIYALTSSNRSDAATRLSVLPLVTAGALAAIAVVGFGLVSDPARDMPWYISPSESRILGVSDSIKSESLAGDAVPIVANPDLGKISFEKRAIMVDLGWLGDPLLARFSKYRPDLETVYLSEAAKPDVAEAHLSWSCRYKDWIASVEFQDAYQLSDPNMATAGSEYNSECPLGGRYAIWKRVEPSAEFEYELTSEIATSPDPLSVIAKAVQQCLAAPGGVFRCQPIRRAVTRNSPMLKQTGLLDEAAEILKQSPSGAFDYEVITRERGWADRAFEQFTQLYEGST